MLVVVDGLWNVDTGARQVTAIPAQPPVVETANALVFTPVTMVLLSRLKASARISNP